MSKKDKVLALVLDGGSDKNIKFITLCRLLGQLGFTLRIVGSHHNFRREGFEGINLQPIGKSANPTKSNKFEKHSKQEHTKCTKPETTKPASGGALKTTFT